MEKRLTISDSSERPLYDIVIRPDYDGLCENLAPLGFHQRRIGIIADENTARLYGKEVLDRLSADNRAFLFQIPAGEQFKTLDTVRSLYAQLIDSHFERGDCLAALGGGVVGDITGFCAATYLRGIAFVQLPTTLLAQSDSSVGGKTGVDFDGYKNMVGAFCMPKLVYMNVRTLQTLESRVYLSGMGEVIKHGLIRDKSFFAWLETHAGQIRDRDAAALMEMDEINCRIKGRIVQEDPTEKGIRSLLNFGHTIGHAVEKYKAGELYHGECVAVGMAAAAVISRERGLITEDEVQRICRVLSLYDLPVTVSGLTPEQVIMAARSDKKIVNGLLRFILLESLGRAVIDTSVTEEEMMKALSVVIKTGEGENAIDR